MRVLACLALVACASPAAAQREFGFDNTKPSGQPYLSPEETVKRMTVAPEFEVKLYAGEPQLANPIAFTIDEKGRVWCVECFEYPSRTPKGKAPRDRIVILEDTDGDGAADKRTVFAEGKDFPVTDERKQAGLGAFDLASGIEVGRGGVFVGAPPYLWFIENKDDKPGKFEVLLKGFGSQDTHETLNTFQWGPDGWLYGLHGVFTQSTVKSLDGPETRMNAAVWRYHPSTKKFEVFAEGTSNPWGMDWRNTDGQFILACCVIPHLYHIVPGAIYKRQAGASHNPYAYGYVNEICDHTFHKESGWAHAGLISLDAPHIPERFRKSVVFGSIHGCSVKQNVLKPNGSSFTATRGDDFLVSGDKNFRPINLKWGPNGDIYLIDWHDQNPCHQAKPDAWDYERGRVYRIQVKGMDRAKAVDFSKFAVKELVPYAHHYDPYTSRTALRLLMDIVATVKEDDVVRALVAVGPGEFRLKLLSLRMTQKLVDPTEAEMVYTPNPLAPVSAAEAALSIRLVTGRLDKCGTSTVKSFIDTTNHKSPLVRRELASAAVRLSDKLDVSELVRALMKHKEDATDPLIPHLVWLAYEKVLASGGRKPPVEAPDPKNQGANAPRSPVEDELAWLAGQAPDNQFVRDQIVPKVMRRLVATGKPADLALCVKFVADLADVNTREKALDGLAVELAGRTVDAPDGWAALEPTLRKEPRLEGVTNKLAVSFRDPKAVARVMTVLGDAAQPPDARAEAVRQLVLLKAKDAPDVLLRLVRDGNGQAMPVRLEAARGLAAFDTPGLAKALVADWKSFAPPLRAELVNTLAGRKDRAKDLLLALGSNAIDRRDVTDNAITRIQAFKDRELNALVEKAWGRTRPTPGELNKLIDAMRGELGAGPASFARGKAVFEAQCAKCHKFDGKGSDVGPALDGAGRDIEYVLANVIDPNRVIGAPYFQRIAKTIDGRVEQGLLAEEDDNFITLKVENGVLKKLPKKDLEGAVTVVEKSMMPEGLTAGMSVQDFRDLVRYVMASPFLTDVSVDGKPATAPPTGRIKLAEAKDAGESVVEAEVTASADVATQLQLGGVGEFEVKLDGVAVGKAAGRKDEPDQSAVPVRLTQGTHKLTIVVKYKGTKAAVYARLLDPDRRLSYPDAGAKK